MKHLNTFLLVSLIIIVGYLLFTRPEPLQPINTTVIEQRIDDDKDSIIIYEKEVEKIYISNNEIEQQLETLMDSLEVFKQKKDTAKIVEVQSKSIVKLQESNDTLKRIIHYKDSIIYKKDDIINNQDTIIVELKRNVKKVKRQRNGSLALNVLQSVLLALKN